MADIDVVPKHRSRTWLWIVLAIVVVAVLMWAFAGRSRTAALLRSPAALAHFASPGVSTLPLTV